MKLPVLAKALIKEGHENVEILNSDQVHISRDFELEIDLSKDFDPKDYKEHWQTYDFATGEDLDKKEPTEEDIASSLDAYIGDQEKNIQEDIASQKHGSFDGDDFLLGIEVDLSLWSGKVTKIEDLKAVPGTITMHAYYDLPNDSIFSAMGEKIKKSKYIK